MKQALILHYYSKRNIQLLQHLENFQTSLKTVMKILFQITQPTSSLKPGFYPNGNFTYCLDHQLLYLFIFLATLAVQAFPSSSRAL